MGMNEEVMNKLGALEKQLSEFQEKAGAEIANSGKVSKDTEQALNKLGETQHEIAQRLLALEQRGAFDEGEQGSVKNALQKQFENSDSYRSFINGSSQKTRMTIQNNTLTGSDSNVAPDRKPYIVPGAMQMMTLEDLFPHLPTSSNAIEYTKEASFTNSAAEASEGAERGESALTWSLVNMPVSNVGHWIKISRQLAADAPALAAYVRQRMIYGVNIRVEQQLGAGNGVAPNLSGILDTGNFTAHGYLSGDLGSTLAKLVLIRKAIADLVAAGYVPDAITLNPADWGQIEIDLLTSTSNAVRVSYTSQGVPMLWGYPVVQSIGITADSFAVGAFGQAGVIHDREDVVVEMSDSDDDNFTKGLVTLRAERRLALAIEVPAAIRGGDLTPPAT